MAPAPRDQCRITSSFPESHIFINFEDDFGQFLFRVDSNTKNRSGLKHIVHVVIMRNTGAISIREIVRDLTPGGVNTVASFDLGRGMFVLDRIDREGTPLSGKETFCITLTINPNLGIKPIHVEVPRGHRLPPERLDLNSGISGTRSIRRIKIHFEYPWANNDLYEEVMAILQGNHGGAGQPQNGVRPELSRRTASVLSPMLPSWPSQPTGNSIQSPSSTRSVKQEEMSTDSHEDSARIRELEERVRSQAADNDKNRKRFQQLETLFRAQAHSKSGMNQTEGRQSDQLGLLESRTLSMKTELSESEREQDKTRIRELEDLLQFRDATIKQLKDGSHLRELETQVRDQAVTIARLEKEQLLESQPDIAALGVELAIARGVQKGDQAGVESRLPSVRLQSTVVERLVGNDVFKSLFLDVSRKRKADLEDGELDELEGEDDKAPGKKRMRTDGDKTVSGSFNASD